MVEFQDLFSKHADCYAQNRPTYPNELFVYLASLVREHTLAWDVGTGNGQAAVDLANHFAHVIATDPSAEQLSHAPKHYRVSYHVATAEGAGPKEGLADSSVDLVTIAQALHWFKFDAFYANVRRVLKPGGVIAAWCYGMNYVTPAVDAAVDRLYKITDPYWAAGRKWIDEKYATIPFPFEPAGEIGVPGINENTAIRSRLPDSSTIRRDGVASTDRDQRTRFECRKEWTLPQFIGYLHSWSGLQRFMAEKGYDPLNDVADELAAAWGPSEDTRVVHWPIYLLLGRF